MDNVSLCIFCNIQSNEEVIRENGFSGMKCPRCGLIYVSPKPSIQSIANLYGHDEAHVSSQSHIANHRFKRLYAKYYLRIMAKFATPGTLLDIGAGGGHFLDEARKQGHTPFGVELNPTQANHICENLKIPCENSALNHTMFEGRKFDIVFHCDVISHFFDPIGEFETINKMMKQDGFLVFETGNLGDVDKKYFKYFTKFQYPDHLFLFSIGNLQELLERTGFKTVATYRHSILPQLMLVKVLSRAKQYVRQQRTHNLSTLTHPQSGADHIQNGISRKNKPSFYALMSELYGYFSYLLRYHVGKMYSNERAPQTVIIVAQKARDVS